MRIVAVLALPFALCVWAPPAAAADASPAPAPTASPNTAMTAAIELARRRLDTMLRTGHADPSWFSASFLAQVPASKVDDAIAQVTAVLGPYRSIEFTPQRFIAHFVKGTDDVLIHLDADDKIDGLLLRPPVTATPGG